MSLLPSGGFPNPTSGRSGIDPNSYPGGKEALFDAILLNAHGDGDISGGKPGGGMPDLGDGETKVAQATTGTMTDAMPGAPGRSFPKPGVLGPATAAAQILNGIDNHRERAAVEGAIDKFGLDRDNPDDVNAARAYVWGKTMAPMPGNYSEVPWSGPANERTAESIMRLEQAVPGTLGKAYQGDPDARARLDAAVDGALAGEPLQRTSSVDPALSASSTRARAVAAVSADGMQNWQAHHKIPYDTVASLPVPVQQKIAQSGWKMDSPGNLMALPGDQASFEGPPNSGVLPMHRGAHPEYNARVSDQFADLIANHDNMSPSEVRAEMDRIEGHMHGEIEARMHHDRVD